MASQVNAGTNRIEWWSAAAGTGTKYRTWMDSSASNLDKEYHVKVTFEAVSPTLYTNVQSVSASFRGNGTISETNLILTEIPDTVITTDFT